MSVVVLLFLACVLATNCEIADYNLIDMSDILNVDFMPGSLLVLENPENEEFSNVTHVPVSDQRGTFDEAFSTMGFHRKMMNEYLCRSYLSKEIITEMKSTRIRRRLGHPNGDKTNSASSKINFSIKNNLLEDEGSSNYQNWLKKSTTLEDIYRHYENSQGKERDDDEGENEEYDPHVTGYGYQQSQNGMSPSKLGHSATGAGFPYQGFPSGGMHSGGGGGTYGYPMGPGGSGYGNGGSYPNTHGEHIVVEDYGNHGGGGHDHSPKYHGGSKDKDKLADLFDIALTALAYLSFGMFIIQVIMCISTTTTTTAPTMTMMPMSLNPTGGDGGMTSGGGMSGGGTGNGGADGGGTDGDMGGDAGGNEEPSPTGGDADNNGGGDDAGGGGGDGGGDDGRDQFVLVGEGINGYGGTIRDSVWKTTESASSGTEEGGDIDGRDEESFRRRRDVPTINQPDNQALNELARRILISIEAAMVAHQDDGNCLRKTLCENNFYSRTLTSNQKYWVPVWSLGMSWLSGRLVEGIPKTTTMLESLKASVLGLGNGDCEFLYSNCDLKSERQRRKRRKRNA